MNKAAPTLPRQTLSTPPIEIVFASEREAAAARWQALEQRLGSQHLKSSWKWISTWLDHFGNDAPSNPGSSHAFAFGRAEHHDIGAAIVPVSNFDLTVCTIPVIAFGTAGEPLRERNYVFHNQLLVEPAWLDAFAQGLMNLIARRAWSVLWIEGFISEQADALMRAGQQIGMRFDISKELSPTFDFRQLHPEQHILQGISHAQRSKIRRSMKALHTQFGPCSVEWATTPAQAHDILEELMHLHTLQWQRKGSPGLFHTERLKNYHRHLIDALFPDHLIAFRVKQGKTTIGCLLNLIEDAGGHITNHRSGFLTFDDHHLNNTLKPGYVTNLLFMTEARARRYTEFDLLPEPSNYKRHITNAHHLLVSAESYKGPRSLAFRSARHLYRKLRTRSPIEKLKERLVK
jgi:hypothetical protein